MYMRNMYIIRNLQADLHFDNVDNDVGLGWSEGLLAADLVKEIWQRALKA